MVGSGLASNGRHEELRGLDWVWLWMVVRFDKGDCGVSSRS